MFGSLYQSLAALAIDLVALLAQLQRRSSRVVLRQEQIVVIGWRLSTDKSRSAPRRAARIAAGLTAPCRN